MTENTKRVLIGIGGGGVMVQAYNLISECPPGIKLILFAPEAVRERLKISLKDRPHVFLDPPRSLKQKRKTSIVDNIKSVFIGTWYSIKVIKMYRPIVVMSVGQRVSIYLMLASRLAGVKGVFIECVTRVTQKSGTGRLISFFRLADKIYVQWPEAEKIYRDAVYRGRLV